MCSRYVELTLTEFAHIVRKFLEVLELKRMSGDIDYLLKDVETDSPPKGTFFKGLFAAEEFNYGSSSFALETINQIMLLPLDKAR